ncbi:unnamed protein product [Prunus armeniaca]|uniref:Uncharacterized protein n=1 Tax=Prunus armeniaca TaxID=36596 RepID=A0A6J5UPK9_PRUAR|nr:unnamed protein product [Prunus armeniaca]
MAKQSSNELATTTAAGRVPAPALDMSSARKPSDQVAVLWQCCRGFCVNTNISPFNCGRCGNRCPFGVLCLYGLCGYAQPTLPPWPCPPWPPFPFPPKRPWPPRPQPPPIME